MTTISNAGAWPVDRLRTRHRMPDGRIVQVEINWDHVYWMARKALENKTQRTTAGPVVVRVVKP